MKKTINVDFTTECSRPETAVKRFVAKYPECAHWADELCFMLTNGTEHECNSDAYGKKWTFSLHAERDESRYYIAVIEREPSTAADREPEPENVLYYEERGCDMDPKYYDGISDVNNHRIVFFDVPGKDGKTFIIECGEYTRCLQGIGVKKRRNFINRLHATLQYENERGCWGISGEYCGINPVNYHYTMSDILRYINAISSEHYTKIQPREKIIVKNSYYNPTGESLMIQAVNDWREFWGQRNRTDFQHKYKVLRTVGGNTYMKIRNYLYEYAGMIPQEARPEQKPDYCDIELLLDRITDNDRVQSILENSIEVNCGLF